MIDRKIIKLASDNKNAGLENKYSHKISLKNNMCGDKITLEIIADKKKINSMIKPSLVLLRLLQASFRIKLKI